MNQKESEARSDSDSAICKKTKSFLELKSSYLPSSVSSHLRHQSTKNGSLTLRGSVTGTRLFREVAKRDGQMHFATARPGPTAHSRHNVAHRPAARPCAGRIQALRAAVAEGSGLYYSVGSRASHRVEMCVRDRMLLLRDKATHRSQRLYLSLQI